MKYFALLLVSITFTSSILLGQSDARIQVLTTVPGPEISRHIYGHFSEHLGRCIYDGFWVSDSSTLPRKDRIRMDIVEALRKIRIPNLRWPGGCFADEYHWRDGVGPRSERPRMVNTNWGNVMEDNSFGTHEFLELCELLGAEPYICGNLGSGTVEEMSKWVEYLNFDGISPMTDWREKNGRQKPWNVQYWGVGNENWGCGGNMTADFYADQYRRYASYAKNYPGAELKKIAGGPSSDDYNWTETLMKKIPRHLMWGISLHHYVVPNDWSDKGSATRFDEAEYARSMQKCLYMDELIRKHSIIMDRYDPERKVGLVVDEWGIWTNVEPGTNRAFLYQQNSLRDALVAATTLNIFNNHSERVRMANLAQTVNVLQALILTEGHKMLLTPTYHVFDLFQVHQDNQKLTVNLSSPRYTNSSSDFESLNVSASRRSDGRVFMTIVNLDPSKAITTSLVADQTTFKPVIGRILTSARYTDHNTFEKPDQVKIRDFTGFRLVKGQWQLTIPPLSVVQLECQ